MRTSHKIIPDVAIEGMALSGYESRPMLLPLRAQEVELVLADSAAGALTLTLQDQEWQILRTLEIALSGATVATSLDEIVAAAQADPYFAGFGTYDDDDTDSVRFLARIAGRSYTLAAPTVPGGMTAPTVNETVSAIDDKGSGVEFGRFVKRGSGDNEIDTLSSGDTVGDLVGLIRRTEGNHFHKLDESLSDVDATLRGQTYPIMEKGRIWVRVEQAVTPASTPFVRISGSGEIGALRADAAGGAAIDASSICRFESSSITNPDGVMLALLKVNVTP